MRHDDCHFLDPIGRCRKPGPQIHSRLRGKILQISAAIALVLAVSYHEILLLAYGIDQMHSAYVGKTISCVAIAEVVAEIELLIRVINHRKPQHHGPAADALELLDFHPRARLLSIRRGDRFSGR